jgi:hypothetical protein
MMPNSAGAKWLMVPSLSSMKMIRRGPSSSWKVFDATSIHRFLPNALMLRHLYRRSSR